MLRTAMKLLGKKEGPKAVLAIQDVDQAEDDAGDGDAGV
jgi:hypothetical protein